MSSTPDSRDGLHQHLGRIRDNMKKTESIHGQLQSVEAELSQFLQSGSENDPAGAELRGKLQDLIRQHDVALRESDSLTAKLPTDAPASSIEMPPPSSPPPSTSSLATGLGFLSPTKRSRKSVRNSIVGSSGGSKPADVKFASEISENLLAECRKLQLALSDKERRLKELEDEADEQRNRASTLESKLHAVSESESTVREDNWNLEVRVRELEDVVSKSSLTVNKMSSETGKLRSSRTSQLEEIDILKQRIGELSESLESTKSRYESDASSRRREHNELEKDHSALQRKFAELSAELKNRSRGKSAASSIPEEDDRDIGDEADILAEGGFETPENSPPLSPVKATPSRMSALETETAKASLTHAHRIANNWQKAFSKEKTEKFELKKQLSEALAQLNELKGSSNSSGTRNKRSKLLGSKGQQNGRALAAGTGAALGAQGRVRTSIIDDDTDQELGQEEGWENVDRNSEMSESDVFQSAFETAQEGTEDDSFQTGQETMDEGSSGENTETEGASSDVQYFGANDLTASDDEDDGQSSFNDTVSGHRSFRRRSFKNKRSVNTLRSSPYVSSAAASDNSGVFDDSQSTPIKGGQHSLAAEFMSVDDIERHAESHGLKSIPVEEYEELHSKISQNSAAWDDPTVVQRAAQRLGLFDESKAHLDNWKSPQYFQSQAASFGFVAIPIDEHQNLLSPSDDALHVHAASKSLKLVPQSSYDALVSPSIDAVTAHAERHGLKTLSDDELNHLQNPSIQEVETHAQRHGLKTFTEDDLKRMQNPTVDEVGKFASRHGLKTLSEDELNCLQNPSTSDVESHASRLGLKAIPENEFHRLTSLTSNPAREDLENWAKPLGLAVLEDAEYRDLTRSVESPTKEELEKKAEAAHLVVIDKGEYNSLLTLAHTPSKAHLDSVSQKQGLVVLDGHEHSKLLSQAQQPDKEHLVSKARDMGHSVIPTEEYDELKQLAHSPPIGHVLNIATASGLVALSSADHEDLIRRAHAPTSAEIEEQAKRQNLSVIPADVHTDLLRKSASPTTAEVSAFAAAHGSVVIDKADHDELLRRAEEPSLEELYANAQSHGHVAISKTEHAELLRLAGPSPTEFASRAGELGLVALPTDEHQRLLNPPKPTKAETLALVEEHGLVAVPKDQYQNMHDAASRPVDKDFVVKSAAGLGLVAIGAEALKKLESPSHDKLRELSQSRGYKLVPSGLLKTASGSEFDTSNGSQSGHMVVLTPEAHQELTRPPTQAELETRVKNAGSVMLPSAEYEALKTPSRTDIETKLAAFGAVAVPKEAYAELSGRPKTVPAPTREEAVAVLENHGLRAVDSKHFDSLQQAVQQPTTEQLHALSMKMGMIALPAAEYTQLTRKLQEPTADELRKLANSRKDLGVSVIDDKALADLNDKAERPSKEVILESANALDLALLPRSELKDLERKAYDPSKAELTTVATRLGLVPVPRAVFDSMESRIQSPSESDVHEASSKLGLRALPATEAEELMRKAHQPTFDELRSAAVTGYGHDLLPSDELIELRRKVEEPTVDELVASGQAKGMSVVPKDVYEELENIAMNPDEATLNKFGSRLGLAVLPAEELTQLRDRANHPSKTDVEVWAKKHNLVTVPREDYQTMADRIESFGNGTGTGIDGQSLQGSPRSRDLSSVAAKRDHFEDIIKQSAKDQQRAKVMESMKSLGYVAVPSEEYKQLEARQQVYEPTKGEIMRAAKSFGLATVAIEEYQRYLQSKGHNRASSSSYDLALGSPTSVSGSSVAPGSPSTPVRTSFASTFDSSRDIVPSSPGIEMKAVPADYLASLRQIAENPTKEDVLGLAHKHGLELVSETKPAPVTPVHVSPIVSLDDVKAKAADFGVTVIPQSELDALRLKATQANQSRPSSIIAAPIVASPLSHEQLTTRAAELGLATISAAELLHLRQTKEVKAQPAAAAAASSPARPLTASDVQSQAKELGLATISMTELEELRNRPSAPEDFTAQAASYGLKAIPQKQFNDLAERAELAQQRALKDGQVAVDSVEYNQLLSLRDKPEQKAREISDDDVAQYCANIGLTTIPVGELRELRQATAPSRQQPSETEVKDHASRFGLAVLPKSELEQLRSLLQFHEPTLRDSLGSPVRVVDNRDSHVTMHSAVVEDVASDTSSEHHYKDAQDEAGPSTHHTVVSTRPPQLTLPAVSEDGSLLSFDYETGKNKDISQPSDNYTTDADAESTLPSAAVLKRGGTNVPGVPAPPHGLPPSGSFTSTHALSISQATIMSHTSMNERNMIPYITQVVIGEFLFKYTRRVALTGISDNRHERFFWIHPYTLTLYWSKENPAIETNKTTKTKSAAIVSVDSVEDLNPLPPGLYHKSIVIHTTDRVVKLTCPSRLRHNIWFNSIRFLLKRSVEGLQFDDEEDPLDVGAEASRVARDQAASRASTARVLSIRRSMAPEMNQSRAMSRSSMRQSSTSSFRTPPSIQQRPGSGSTSRSSSRLSRT